jgi:hypothetical protein
MTAFHVVLYHDEGEARLLSEGSHEVQHLQDFLGVHAGDRFIEEQKSRLGSQRHRQA